MVSNEKYIGDVIIEKTYCNDFPYNERRVNKGKYQKYLINGSHTPLITTELFDQVQAEKIRRSNIQIDGNKLERNHTNTRRWGTLLDSFINKNFTTNQPDWLIYFALCKI